jgi:potassium large conductance calcium-activated channel subfamily M alpha member 1
MCVIISSVNREANDEHLIDKAAILCSLNIKAMNFDDSVGLLDEAHHILPPGMSPFGNIEKINMKSRSLFGTHVPMLTELSKIFISFSFF